MDPRRGRCRESRKCEDVSEHREKCYRLVNFSLCGSSMRTYTSFCTFVIKNFKVVILIYLLN